MAFYGNDTCRDLPEHPYPSANIPQNHDSRLDRYYRGGGEPTAAATYTGPSDPSRFPHPPSTPPRGSNYGLPHATPLQQEQVTPRSNYGFIPGRSPPPLLPPTMEDSLRTLDRSPTPMPMPTTNQDLLVHVVEATKSTIQDQASTLRRKEQENEQLRKLLMSQERELQNRKSEPSSSKPLESNLNDDHLPGPIPQQAGPSAYQYRHELSNESAREVGNNDVWSGGGVIGDPQNSLVIHPIAHAGFERWQPSPPKGFSGLPYAPSHDVDRSYRALHYNDSRFYPVHQIPHIPVAYSGFTPPLSLHQDLLEPNISNAFHKQEIAVQSSSWREQNETSQLRNQLLDAEIKEKKLVQERFSLESQLSALHLIVEQYQAKLMEAASRAVSVHHDVMDENEQILACLKDAERDLALYKSSLLPILAEFNLQPADTEPHSIIIGIKRLVQFLRGSSNMGEERPRDPPYYTPTVVEPPSPIYPVSQLANTYGIPGQDIVSQQARVTTPSPPLNANPRNWESPRFPRGMEPLDGRGESNPDQQNSLTNGSDRFQNVNEDPINSAQAGNATRSFSGSEDDDPLPAIEGLTINGEALLGNKIIACGVSKNGTALCNFQWVRHSQDETSIYIDGAVQPDYVISADDIGTILSLECIPLDDRNRKAKFQMYHMHSGPFYNWSYTARGKLGDVVRVFANDRDCISLDVETRKLILEYTTQGHASFNVEYWMEASGEEEEEPATLIFKRSGFELKRSNTKKVISEKYISDTSDELLIKCYEAKTAILQRKEESYLFFIDFADGRARDLAVLVMREFKNVAIDRKAQRRGFWGAQRSRR